MGASVITGVDASAVFELAEQVLDLVALAVEVAVVRDGQLAVCLRWFAGSDASLFQSGAEPVDNIAPIGEHCLGPRQRVDHQPIGLADHGCQFSEDPDEHA